MNVDRKVLESILNDICGSRLCSVNSMSSEKQSRELLQIAIDSLNEVLNEPDHVKRRLTDDDIWDSDDIMEINAICGLTFPQFAGVVRSIENIVLQRVGLK